jgi:hypothetical protein
VYPYFGLFGFLHEIQIIINSVAFVSVQGYLIQVKDAVLFQETQITGKYRQGEFDLVFP